MAPHFFNIVFFPLEQGLKIPSAFMAKFGDELQKMVFLKVTNGASWQVELVDCDNATWLRKGWQQFAEYYSIKKFHFLVFRYDGNSQFHVHIFDSSASEIEYPFEAGTSTGQTEGDESVQILSDIPTNQGSKRKLRPQGNHVDHVLQDTDVSVEILGDDVPPVCNQRMTRSSRRKTSESNQTQERKLEELNKVESSGCSEESERQRQKNQGRKRREGHLKSSISNRRTSSYKEKFIAFQKAKAFSSTKPFFISFMQPSCVSGSCILSIPSSFVRTYLSDKDKQCNWVLRVPGPQQTWPVTRRCTRNANTWPVTCSGRRSANITTGWKRFVEDNNLKMSDACVFELESGTNFFNVIIYRNVEHL